MKRFFRDLPGYIAAIVMTIGVGFVTYWYFTYLQDHGCVIGTKCISITR